VDGNILSLSLHCYENKMYTYAFVIEKIMPFVAFTVYELQITL